MKKILLMMFALVLAAGTLKAQLPINEGNFFVNANVSDVTISFSDNTSFNLGAHGGYFLMDKLALMGGLNVFTSSGYSSFGINAGARYYFMEQSKGSFFAGGLLGVSKQSDVDATFALQLQGGYAYFLNQNVALEPMLSLRLPFSDGENTTFSIGCGISVYF